MMRIHVHLPARILAFLVLTVCPALAQESAEEIRRERMEKLEDLRRTEQVWKNYDKGPTWKYKFGSWLSTSYSAADNDDRDGASPDILDHVWDNDLRFYASGRSGTDRTKFYARLGTTYTANSKTSVLIRKSDWVQPTFDMLYLEKSLGQKVRHNFTLGRQFVGVKGSLVFALVADGIKYDFKTRRQTGEFFLVRQQPGDNNIDYLMPSPGRTKRWFAGAQYSWDYNKNHSINFFGVQNNDENSDKADASGQRHGLDSFYFGTTFSGTWLSRLKYEFQYVMEWGKTFSDSNNNSAAPSSEVDIDAGAIMTSLHYYFPGPINLVVHTDYLYGSGDGDAVGNVVSTTGGSGSLTGSGAGGNDQRFISFGGKNLGYALSPTLTNLRVSKTGFGFKPFYWTESRLWSDMTIHPDFYFYWRDKATGATSDPYMIRGNGASKNIGREYDMWVSWRLMSDVKYHLKIGKFYPGAAYQTRTPETIIRFKISVDL